jgi:hypothetical protein
MIFFDNPSDGSRVIRSGRTDGQTATTNRILAFRKCVNRVMKFTLT